MAGRMGLICYAMMQRFSLPPSEIEFVFDLDDTLYFERDYSRSALMFVGKLIAKQYQLQGASTRLLELLDQGASSPIDCLWSELALPADAKSGVVTAMHAHSPDIRLRPDANILLDVLRTKRLGFTIVTDGRSITQRAKLTALGCIDAKYISISEEVGLPKTDYRRFKLIEAKFAARQYCYVADNPENDFVAPNSLGWNTFMLLDGGFNIHPQRQPDNPSFAAKFDIRSLIELDRFVGSAVALRH